MNADSTDASWQDQLATEVDPESRRLRPRNPRLDRSTTMTEQAWAIIALAGGMTLFVLAPWLLVFGGLWVIELVKRSRLGGTPQVSCRVEAAARRMRAADLNFKGTGESRYPWESDDPENRAYWVELAGIALETK